MVKGGGYWKTFLASSFKLRYSPSNLMDGTRKITEYLRTARNITLKPVKYERMVS
jgi:hypothetical protein